MKKIIIACVITAIISIFLTFLGIYIYGEIQNNNYDSSVAESGLKNITEIDYDIPEFYIIVSGVYDSVITNEDIDSIKTYEIEAVMDDGIYKDLYVYKGVKIKDVIESYEIEEYNNITFISSGRLQVTYNPEEITDNMFLVFEVDGIEYEESEPAALLNTDFNERYSITNIQEISFD